MSVGRICTRVVATASPDETIRTVAKRMVEYNVGTVVIAKGPPKPLGIVTDRDIVTRCVASGHDPETTPVSVIMTQEVRTVDEAVPIEQALRTMAGAETRRLVVTGEEGRLVGLVSLDDVLELLTEEAEAIGRLLRQEAPRLAES
jgi:CBS domain-containing protein